jgi:hypothetical protein
MEGMDDVLTPEDDNFHRPDEHWWWHETCFFYFAVHERKIGCWLYNYIRPNIGVSGGGCWVWDDKAFFHMEAPYFACYAALQLPEQRDLRDFRFPSGVGVKVLEPLQKYHLTYVDREWIDVDVIWDAVQKPWVRAVGDPPVPLHWEQFGRVTGTLTVHGDEMDVDVLAMRDRTWSPRGERWKDGGGSAYASAAVSGDLNFLATGGEQVRGFFTSDGERRAIASGTRVSERHPEHGYVTRIELDGTDTAGASAACDRRPGQPPGVAHSRGPRRCLDEHRAVEHQWHRLLGRGPLAAHSVVDAAASWRRRQPVVGGGREDARYRSTHRPARVDRGDPRPLREVPALP